MRHHPAHVPAVYARSRKDLNNPPHCRGWDLELLPMTPCRQGSEQSTHCREWDLELLPMTPCRKDLNNPLTAVSGFRNLRPVVLFRKDLNNPLTAVSGISEFHTASIAGRFCAASQSLRATKSDHLIAADR